jgi:uracil-DNA glycosylase family 4
MHGTLFPNEHPVKQLKSKAKKGLGCTACTLDKVPGVNKIFGDVLGKEAMVWAQSPGAKENERRVELIGPTGELLWRELGNVGISRNQVDVMNAVKCAPADWIAGKFKIRTPTPEEIKCCSIYTEQAIAKQTAKVHLILGKIAAEQILGKSYPKTQKVFWSDKLRGKVIVTYHPAYFLRGASEEKFREFQDALKLFAQLYKEGGDRFSYIRKQHYVGVKTKEQAKRAYKRIRQLADEGQWISADIEYDVIDGKIVMLCCGLCGKPGESFVFLLKDTDPYVAYVLKCLLEDSRVPKLFQFGCSDVSILKDEMGIETKNYSRDTIFTGYFKDPAAKTYKLAEQTAKKLPVFVGYKDITAPARNNGELHLSTLSENDLVTYNGADCDVTKQLELMDMDVRMQPLMQTYIDASFILRKMEKIGPLFDYEQCNKQLVYYTKRVDRLRSKLQYMSGDPEFNPGSPKQVVPIIYNKLKLLKTKRNGKRPVDEEALVLVAKKHKFPKYILDYRHDSKLKGTYLEGFKKSADLHDGRLSTIWRETGTSTGRMSSGGRNEQEGVVNFQNIHKDAHLQNMLLSDAKAKQFINEFLTTKDKAKLISRWGDLEIFLIYDFSQMEVRYLAQVSNCKLLIKQFLSGDDIHCQVGGALGYDPKIVAEDEDVRTTVKSMHFGIIYGLMVDALHRKLVSEGIKITREEVQNMYDTYFKQYPEVRVFIESCVQSVLDNGFIENLWGFRRPLKVNDDNMEGEAYWKNQATNSGIQGGAHQVLLMVLALMHRYPQKYSVLGIPYMEVHDSLVFGVKLRNLNRALKVGKQLMEKDVMPVIKNEFNVNWVVPLEAEAKISLRFGTKVKLKGQPLSEALEKCCTESLRLDNELDALLAKRDVLA